MGKWKERAMDLQQHAEFATVNGAKNHEDVMAYVRTQMPYLLEDDEKYVKTLELEFFGEVGIDRPRLSRKEFFKWLNSCPTHEFEIVYDDYDGVYVNFTLANKDWWVTEKDGENG